MHRRIAGIAWLVVAASAACICVERPKRMTDDERGQLEGRILTAPPATMEHRLDANLDNRIELLGYDFKAQKDAQGRILPGTSITITWYWKCKEPLEEGWKLFTHVVDSTGDSRVPSDSRGLVREHYPPSAWRAGEVIVDEQVIPIPADFNSKTLTIFTGAWYGPHRLPVVNDAPNDGNVRVRVGPLDVQYDLASANIPQTDETITLDGRLDEPAWSRAATLGPFVRTPDGPPAPARVAARALWDSRFLYVAFQVQDRALVSQFTDRDAPIYTQDAVELFLDEDGDGKDYYEFEASPSGVLFDCYFATRRSGEPKQFTAADYQAGVSVDGTVNAGADDRSYTIELRIPFAALSKFRQRTPRIGSTWRANLYVLDMLDVPANPQQQPQPTQEGLAWSAPKTNDFHEFRRFGEWTFVGMPTAPVAPPAIVPVAPPAPVEPAAPAPLDPAAPAAPPVGQ